MTGLYESQVFPGHLNPIFVVSQAGLFANGTGQLTHEIWQRLLQASPNLQQQQQQLLAHMHSMMPQGLPQNSVLPQQVRPAAPLSAHSTSLTSPYFHRHLNTKTRICSNLTSH